MQETPVDRTQAAQTPYDAIIIGGGIIGTGIVRDAALRGLRVALFEKEDFGAGTTSRSTRLIHGGLRYLQHLDFGLVRDDLRERERLLRNAPHLVTPLPFLIPYYQNSLLFRAKMRGAMLLYDLLSFDKSLPGHRILNRTATLAREPSLNPEGLQGAALYYDAQVNAPERLCIENIVDAMACGAQIFNHTEVTGALREESRIVGVRVRNRLTGEERDFRASVVVNASGPWFDSMAGLLTNRPSHRIRRTKGIHFAAPIVIRHAVVLFSERDGRLFFLVPWLRYTWVGTTDTDFDGDPSETHALREEMEYLLRDARRVLPGAPWETIYFTHAGVRALVREDGKNASAVSRKHLLVDHGRESGIEGLVSVLGGKITAFRSIAEGTVDLLCRKIGCDRRSQTATQPLPGGRFESREALRAACENEGRKIGLTAEQAQYLIGIYGARYTEVLALAQERPELAGQLHPDYPDIRAQVHHAILREHCRTVSDFLMRRSLLFFSPDQGRAALEALLQEMAALFSWTEERRRRERAEYEHALELSAVPVR